MQLDRSIHWHSKSMFLLVEDGRCCVFIYSVWKFQKQIVKIFHFQQNVILQRKIHEVRCGRNGPYFFPWLLSLLWHTLDSKLAHYNWSQKCVTTNLGDSQLAVWHGTNFWQLHCQLYTARNPCCTGLHLELVLWLLRLCICAGEDLNQILTSALCRFTDNLVFEAHI